MRSSVFLSEPPLELSQGIRYVPPDQYSPIKAFCFEVFPIGWMLPARSGCFEHAGIFEARSIQDLFNDWFALLEAILNPTEAPHTLKANLVRNK